MQLQSNSTNHILFVDPSVDNYLSLLHDLNTNTEVFLLDGSKDGIQQITNILASKQNLHSIQILSHGLPAQLHLGNSQLNSKNLQDYSEQLSLWGKALSLRGDILLYGCNLAEGETGQSFIREFSRLTGANVAASDDPTGHSNLGGDWDLEFQVGNITARSVLSEQATKLFAGVLNTNIKGWDATFYSNENFNGNTIRFVDNKITENWDVNNHGVPGQDNDFFSAIWKGYFVPEISGNYSFGMWADDLIQVQINGNSWEHRIGNNKRVENTFLEAGRVYETTVKFREDRGTAMAVFDMTNP
ncbi:MAG: DUF4347 domain-containing protein, partial [Microcoleaceae cyanobacterium]